MSALFPSTQCALQMFPCVSDVALQILEQHLGELINMSWNLCPAAGCGECESPPNPADTVCFPWCPFQREAGAARRICERRVSTTLARFMSSENLLENDCKELLILNQWIPQLDISSTQGKLRREIWQPSQCVTVHPGLQVDPEGLGFISVW